jgi:hypothetical protein
VPQVGMELNDLHVLAGRDISCLKPCDDCDLLGFFKMDKYSVVRDTATNVDIMLCDFIDSIEVFGIHK